MIVTLIDYQLFGIILIAGSAGVLLGHALGYSRAKDLARRNRNRKED